MAQVMQKYMMPTKNHICDFERLAQAPKHYTQLLPFNISVGLLLHYLCDILLRRFGANCNAAPIIMPRQLYFRGSYLWPEKYSLGVVLFVRILFSRLYYFFCLWVTSNGEFRLSRGRGFMLA